MTRVIRLLSLFLAIIMLISAPAYATENLDQRSSNYFAAYSVYLYKISNTRFQAWFEVTAVGGMQKLGVSTIKIQRSTDNDNWKTVALYEMENYSNMTASNTSSHEGYVTYTFITGYYYRAHIKLYAKDSSGTATYDTYTSSLDLR